MDRLTETEIIEVLTDNGIGVLALCGGESAYPYPLPVAFGYDPATDRLALNLEGDHESEKFQYLDHTREVGMAVYEETEPKSVWRSVLLEGELTETSYGEVESALATLTKNTQSAPNPVAWGDASKITPYELRIDDWSGREFHI